MKRRILSVLCTLFVLCGVILNMSVNVRAEGEDSTGMMIDGSLLINDEYSKGTSFNPMLRGKHLMDGDSIISKVGNGKIYVYGQTTANHDVDYVAVLMYVERLDEEKDWESVTSYSAEKHDAYYVIADDTLRVERGHYYRVRCEHFAGNDDEEMYDSAISYTDGIWIP